ncbi:MAG TPA: precorrin-3B C(17)-methyltransferase [Lentisphaeria bacterium]|nr:MAG: precorrin-3B C(17)-methyltransferase [Lentisphaerae bacterium GWF2_49_21]HBC88936.1 precorrin-3B C(17)-methyltransferase [Lentisphaeria bacterium]
MKTKTYIVGLGCRRGTTCGEISKALTEAMGKKKVAVIATCTLKSDEKGLLEYAEAKGVKLVFFTPEELSRIEVPSPSEKVRKHIDSSSVCEAAAILTGGRLVSPKTIFGGKITIAVAEPLKPKGILSAVGIGSGAIDQITENAKFAILSSDTVAGYGKYLDQIPSLLKGKKKIATGMTHEVERCRLALDAAASGKNVSVVCSGDAGIYGMTGLLLELAEQEKYKGVKITNVPGITAAISAASALGAPLMNDFAMISLSDLLTPKQTIIKRIRLLAASDMVCAIYNPRSHSRKYLMAHTIKYFKKVRGKDTKFGIVKNAGRTNELTICGTLDHFPEDFVDMSTLVIIGNSKTILRNGKLYTLRGYKIYGT